MNDRSLPPAPPLRGLAPTLEVAAPIHQEKPTDKDGGPLEALSTCRWCGGMHPTACPFIKIAEWHPSGQLARIVLKERVDLEKAILYPFEEDSEILTRSLKAIAETDSLKTAHNLATALLQAIEAEK